MRNIDTGTEPRLQGTGTQLAGSRFTRRNLLARGCALFLAAGMAFMPSVSQAGAAQGIGGKKSLNTFFSNLYIGAYIDRMLMVDPNDPAAIIAAATQSYVEIGQSDPAKRTDAVAAEIMARNPDVVGLVEVYTLQLGEISSPTEFSTVFDYLGLLTEALEARGGHYEVATIATETDVAMPVLLEGEPKMARLIDHEVILVRSDLPPGQLRYGNPMAGHFEYRIVIPDFIDVLRGWCSIDMSVRGERFRLICAHLETEALPDLQYAQGLELLSGPANTALPVVLMGDFNTDPLGRDGSITYPLFGQAGFTDSWNVVNPQDPAGGLTWGHDPWLSDPSVTFDRRIDLILYRGAQFTAGSFEVISPQIGDQPPLWFSDHASVSANVYLGNPKSVRGAKVAVSHRK